MKEHTVLITGGTGGIGFQSALGIARNVLFPGRASTSMTRSLSVSSLPGLMKRMYPIFKILFQEDGGKSAAKAARSTIWGKRKKNILHWKSLKTSFK